MHKCRFGMGKIKMNRFATEESWLLNSIAEQLYLISNRKFKQNSTEIYTHVLKRGAHGVRSPLSDLNNA